MLKIFKIVEEIDEQEKEVPEPEKTEDKSLQKICYANQKNELISIVYNMLHENLPHWNRYEIERHISMFIGDMKNLKEQNHHFNRYVIWSLFDCFRKSNSRFDFVGKTLNEFNLMCYGANKLGSLFDIYWNAHEENKLSNAVIEQIIEIWETRSCS